MSETNQVLPKAKKSVALSGTAAGNTALCTVGRSGNDLHYRGYDIHDLATKSTFEEVAHLLVHGSLPTASQLRAYRTKLKRLRGLPAIVTDALELVPANAHPMDVMRTGCSVLGAVLPEKESHPVSEARDIADRLVASFGSMLLYWHHYALNGRRIDTETDDESVAAHFLHLLHGEPTLEHPRLVVHRPVQAAPARPAQCAGQPVGEQRPARKSSITSAVCCGRSYCGACPQS